MNTDPVRQLEERQRDLQNAALRYAAVADWFEARRGQASDPQAWDAFNQAEADLRQAGRKLLALRQDRAIILQTAGVREAVTGTTSRRM